MRRDDSLDIIWVGRWTLDEVLFWAFAWTLVPLAWLGLVELLDDGER